MAQNDTMDAAIGSGVDLAAIKDLSPENRHLYEHAKSAIKSGNRAYGVPLLLRLLLENPGCAEARKYLLAVLHERGAAGPSGFFSCIAGVRSILAIRFLGGRRLRRRDWVGALRLADRSLCAKPRSKRVLFYVHHVNSLAGFPDVAAAALEFCHLTHPRDLETLDLLRSHYRTVDDPTREAVVAQRMCELCPNDLQLQSELKQAVARATIKRDKWEEATTFRDVVKDEKEADVLEKQLTRGGRDEKTIDELLDAARIKLAENESSSAYREVGDLLLQKKDYVGALDHFQRASQMAERHDPGLEDRVIMAQKLQFDNAIQQWRKAGSRDEAYRQESLLRVAEIEKQKRGTLMYLYRDRVMRFPLQAKYHFELADILFEEGDFDAALREYQEASGNPAYRTQALVCIGKCMAKKGITDLAIEQLLKALAGRSDRMDAERKDILYTLALLHMDNNDREQALPLLKEIYAVDSGYRDVEAHIQHFYSASE